MDTIIYLAYHRSDNSIITVKKMTGYYLLWGTISRDWKCEKEIAPPEEKKKWRIPFISNRKQENIKLQKQKEEQEALAEKMYPILKCYQELEGRSDICHTVYDGQIISWLQKKGLTELWQELWPFPTFIDYHNMIYFKELYSCEMLPYVLVIGYHPQVPEWILQHQKKIKNLRFIIDFLPGNLDGFLEDLYEEYGLMATYKILPGTKEHPYRRENIQCIYPTVILDYCEEEHMLIGEVKEGSIWVDMNSMEEKRRRIEGRYLGVNYKSLRKHWKQRGELLDTPVKNGYNTEVNWV